MNFVTKIETEAKDLFEKIESKFGVISKELESTIIPDGLSLGVELLKLANSPVGEIVLDNFINPTLVKNIEAYLTKGITALTTAENILSLPTPQEQLTAFATWLQSLTADSKDAFVIKLVQIIVGLADGNKFAQNVYDTLVQSAVTANKLSA